MTRAMTQGFLETPVASLHPSLTLWSLPLLYLPRSQLLIGKKPVLPLGKDRFTLQAGVYSLAQQTMVATGEEVCVSYDYSALAKIDLPDDFRRALEAVAENPAE